MINTFAAVVISISAHAQTSDVFCDDSTRLKKTLNQDMRAERQGLGLRDPDTTMELWVTKGTGEWLMIHHYANGTSCIVAMGEHWSADKPSSVQG